MNKLTDIFELYNGVQVPCVGYGTYLTPDGEIAKNSVMEAINVGYRHIDTAFAYGNEKAVGEGIKASGVKREDIFVTTKHWVTMRGYEKATEAIDVSLENLGLDYLDLYLIHWPCVEKVSPDWKEINAATWRAFEDAYKNGKIRAIGVSNFQKKHYDALAERCDIKPMVNQIEFHPGYTQPETVAYSQEMGCLFRRLVLSDAELFSEMKHLLALQRSMERQLLRYVSGLFYSPVLMYLQNRLHLQE